MTSSETVTPFAVAFVRFGDDGLVPAILQDVVSRRVLMVGFMNAEALAATRRTGLVHFWSRSRATLWQKGETSGNVSRVVELRVNCEQNSLLVLVEQVGAICHEGYPSCFYRRVDPRGELEVVEPRIFDPADVYGHTGPPAGRRPLRAVVGDWYGAYEFLRDHDLGSESTTSRRLRAGEDVRGRVADELRELAGVLDGSHRHGAFGDDVALEAGQVLYWLALVSVGQRLTLDAFDLMATLQAPGTSSFAGLNGERLTLLALSHSWPLIAGTDLVGLIQTTVAALARVCGLVSVEIAGLIGDDLRELRSRSYLAGYFEGAASEGQPAAGSGVDHSV